jgi:hypothetical protein
VRVALLVIGIVILGILALLAWLAYGMGRFGSRS